MTARKIITYILIFVSYLWIGYLILREKKLILKLFLNFNVIQLWWLCISLLLGCMAVYLNLIVFFIIMKRLYRAPINLKPLSNLFFQSQIVKYLPGRIFGILFQITKTRNEVAAGILIRANIDFMVLTIFVHGLASLIIYLWFTKPPEWAMTAVVISLFIIFIWLRFDVINRILKVISYVVPERFRKHFHQLGSAESYRWTQILSIMGCYLVSWVFYLPAWGAVSRLFPSITENFFLLCAFYTISWIVGFLSMITPSGLGIREVFFVYVSSHITSESYMAFLAVFIRLWLMIIDVLLTVFSALINRKGSGSVINPDQIPDHAQKHS